MVYFYQKKKGAIFDTLYPIGFPKSPGSSAS